MNILYIYEYYAIPYNLQLHMLRVAAVGKIVCDHITSQVIDADLIIKTLLLHDMGNIIKFNFNITSMFTPEDRETIEAYKNTQVEFMRKYGNNADEATLQIIEEITSDKRIIKLCKNSHGDMAHHFVNGAFWHEKICYYADMRIGLNGILSVDERFEDLKHRYPQELKEMLQYHKTCKMIEEQIQKICTFDLQSIIEAMLEKKFDELRQVAI